MSASARRSECRIGLLVAPKIMSSDPTYHSGSPRRAKAPCRGPAPRPRFTSARHQAAACRLKPLDGPCTCAGSGVDRARRVQRPRREPAERLHAVVHDDRAGDREIDAEPRRDPHHVVAARQHRRRQRAALRPEHVGGVEGVAEARQLDRVVDQLAADQPAAARQLQRLHRRRSRRPAAGTRPGRCPSAPRGRRSRRRPGTRSWRRTRGRSGPGCRDSWAC